MRTPLPRVSRRGRVVVGIIIAALILLILSSSVVDLLVAWLWYDEVGYTEVFSTVLNTRALLFAVFGGAMGLWIAGNLYLAYRLRPQLRPHSPEQQNLERYRMRITPHIGLYITLAAVLVGLVAGLSAQGRWEQWLLFRNSQEFGRGDPQFNVDIGFYIFEYPFWRYLLSVGFTAVVVAVLGALFVHYLYGGVRLQGAGDRMTAAARAHLSVLVALFVLLKAVAYYFDRFGLVLEGNSSIGLNGAGYADVNALLVAKEILIWIAIIVAVAVIVLSNFVVRNLLAPGVALALVVISAIAIGGVYPWAVQTFQVNPNQRDLEAEYIARSIQETRYAYGLYGDRYIRQTYRATNTTPPQSLAEDTVTQESIRLLDPNVVADTYTELQQVRGFYDFNEQLDIDRYEVAPGEVRDYVVGVRELNPNELEGNQRDWQNRHTVFTHGYGFVAAPANRICSRSGGPYFVSGFLASEEEAPEDVEGEAQQAQQGGECAASQEEEIFEVERPQIYFGELSTDYSIVGAPEGASPREFDRPTATADGDASEQINITYDGEGGVPVNTMARRLLFALYFWETNFLLADVFNEESRVLYNRQPRERVQDVAPFLTVDGDPYPAVINGRIVWILDGYTTASTFPYSESVNLEEAASDALTGTGTTAQAEQNINYIRNSVKATVDAYDGTVTLYEWDETDPVLRAWDQAFGGIIVDKEDIPEELAAHFRYPEDLFKVQRDILVRFHVTDPQEFFGQQDFWEVPADPTQDGNAAQPPYYLLSRFTPNQEEEVFQLTAAVTARNRENLAALITGYYEDNEPRLEVLELPGNTPILGPAQVQQQIDSYPDFTRDRSQFQASQTVVYGNLLTLPVGDGLLYVEPIYLRSNDPDGSYPLLQRVLLVYGEYVSYAPNLQEAIQNLLEAAARGEPPATEEPAPDEEEPPASPSPDTSQTPSPPPPAADGVDPEVAAAVAAIDQALEDLRRAQESGDFEAYGRALADLERAVQAFEEATGGQAPPVSSPPPVSPTPQS